MPLVTPRDKLIEMARGMRQLSVVRFSRPTRLWPGDPRREIIVRYRIKFRLPSRMPGDRELPPKWTWLPRRGKNGREVERTLLDDQGDTVLVVRLLKGKWRRILTS